MDASMASATFDDKIERKETNRSGRRPFYGKAYSWKACLELMTDNSIIAIQDMGAAGSNLVKCRDGIKR